MSESYGTEFEIRQEIEKRTTKEILQKLKLWLNRPTEDIRIINTEMLMLEKIEKDLEVLEALKRNVGIRLAIQEWANKESNVLPNDRKIVKEWLENDKQ